MKHLYKFMNRQNIPWVKLIWEAHYQNNKLPQVQAPCGSFWWKDVLSCEAREAREAREGEQGRGGRGGRRGRRWNNNYDNNYQQNPQANATQPANDNLPMSNSTTSDGEDGMLALDPLRFS